MTDIFLYPGEPNPADIVLRDPTTGASAIYVKVGTGVMVLTASGLKNIDVNKTGGAVMVLTASGEKIREITKTGNAISDLQAAGFKVIEYTKTGAAIMVLTASGVSVYVSGSILKTGGAVMVTRAGGISVYSPDQSNNRTVVREGRIIPGEKEK